MAWQSATSTDCLWGLKTKRASLRKPFLRRDYYLPNLEDKQSFYADSSSFRMIALYALLCLSESMQGMAMSRVLCSVYEIYDFL